MKNIHKLYLDALRIMSAKLIDILLSGQLGNLNRQIAIFSVASKIIRIHTSCLRRHTVPHQQGRDIEA